MLIIFSIGQRIMINTAINSGCINKFNRCELMSEEFKFVFYGPI